MKTVGLLGGMSWESSLEYYRLINQQVRHQLGGFHSAKIIMHSVDFAEIQRLQSLGKWQDAGQILSQHASGLEKCGSDFVVICTNTMHKVADTVQKSLQVPLVNIVEVTAQAILKRGCRKVGLLGTRFTMEDGFYQSIMDRHGIQVLVPSEEDRPMVHNVIFDELIQGKVVPQSKEKYIKVAMEMSKRGAEGIILGCTEIGMLVSQEDLNLPVFDSTHLHVESIVEKALETS